MKRVTSHEVARLAGVSQSTVSRALRNSPLVTPETRQRVQRIARQQNYVCDTSASSLRLQASRTIAVLVHEELEQMASVINPFFLSLLASITRAAAARHYDVLLSFQQLSENWVADYENSNKAEGIILLGYGGYTDYISKIELLDNAHVLTWGPVIDGQPGHFCGCDNRQGGSLAARHLLGLGHREIAFLGDVSADAPEFRARYDGYREALGDGAAARLHALQVDAGPTERSGYQAAQALLRRGRPFTAVFCCSDLIALGAIHALNTAGIGVPSAVSVVGFDDSPLMSHTTPALTTIRQDTTKAGAVMVDMLLKLIRGEDVRSETLPPELVSRESCMAL